MKPKTIKQVPNIFGQSTFRAPEFSGVTSPPQADIIHLLCVLPTILQVFFVHWALGLGGLAGALGARPAALPEKGADEK